MEFFDHEHYLTIAKNKSYREAIHQLHQDLWKLEQKCFDGDDGYQPELWKKLNEMRLFSRDLWDLEKQNPTLPPEKTAEKLA